MIRRWLFFMKERTVARSIHTRRKLGEAVQVMHEGAWFLGVVRQLWPPKRGEQWRYTVELDGGERILANAADIQRQKHMKTSDPTPQEIAERAAEIRAEWPPEMLLSRWQGPKTQPVEIQRIGKTSSARRLESDE